MKIGLRGRVWRDAVIIAFSVVLGIVLVAADIVPYMVAAVSGVAFLGSFVAGMFFTSIFTAVPAMVVLGQIAEREPVLAVALWGAAGAMLGDFIIFSFIRDSVVEDFLSLVGEAERRRLRLVFRIRFLRWLLGFVGALVIASPLPDELGLAMMGLSKMKKSIFFPASFVLNFLGILVIGLAARSLP